MAENSLCSETKPLLVKRYTGKFPIQRRGVKVPWETVSNLKQMMKRDSWTKDEEVLINTIVNYLRDRTIKASKPHENTSTKTS